jgi:hypothetical protein
MFKGWLISFIALAVTTVGANGIGRAIQVPEAQTPIFTSGAELVVVHVTVKDRRGAYVTDPGRLKRLARATGGESFFPRHVNEVGDVLRQIAQDIRHSYTLGYVSSNSARNAAFHQIRVSVTDAKSAIATGARA